MAMLKFGGVYAAPVTPFTARGELNKAVVSSLTAFLLESGLAGVCPVGTTGEFPQLIRREKETVVKLACEAAGARGAVIAGIWAERDDERAGLARAAAKNSARAVFLTTPIFYPASPASLLDWYRGVRRHTNLPLFAYNIPQFAMNEIPIDVLEILAGEGTIQGYKDSSPAADRLERAARRLRDKIPVFAGNEGLFHLAKELGLAGFISGVAGVFPKTVLAVWNGDRNASARLAVIKTAVGAHGGIAALKFLLSLRGINAGEARELVAPLTDSDRKTLESLYREYGPAEE